MIAHRLLKATVAAAALCAAGAASASSITYDFNATGVSEFGAGPYGTVLLETNVGGGVDFTVTLRSDLNFVNTGSKSVFSFNALTVATTDVTGILFAGSPDAKFTVVAPGENEPFGKTFTLMIDCTAEACKNGAPGQTLDPLTFTVANSVLTDFGFLVTGTTAFFASDVICTDTLREGSCNGKTGAIGVTRPGRPGDETEVPEPGSLALLGLGLLGLGLSRRRKT